MCVWRRNSVRDIHYPTGWKNNSTANRNSHNTSWSMQRLKIKLLKRASMHITLIPSALKRFPENQAWRDFIPAAIAHYIPPGSPFNPPTQQVQDSPTRVCAFEDTSYLKRSQWICPQATWKVKKNPPQTTLKMWYHWWNINEIVLIICINRMSWVAVPCRPRFNELGLMRQLKDLGILL